MRLFVLGASGGVGSSLLQQAVSRGHRVTAQTRTAGKVTETAAVQVAAGLPTDRAFLQQNIVGHDAVVFCVGIGSIGKTTLFSAATEVLISAMQATGVRRLIAVTGIGAGNTKGHGGWFYNFVTFPLFTRNRYADKDRQEIMIERSDLDWTIIRPAPFSTRAASGPFQVYTDIPSGLQLSSITRAEVEAFILDCLENSSFMRQKPFIGHA
ncbi:MULTISPECIES: NAD(P)-dependent oxidoreductase [unclassified Nitrobacter]|uniref:NAD(P)-dependent oxidoreductase n=1 Tax=unclassified Nitrobacter TaxID=2620411 RepID=UPI00092B20E7|nr:MULTISPECIES: NAD(P)H-binding protein [unclassified Nitrobacter]MBN9149433.1 NAD(P)H-binding protein [Nitrobacter sp.]OJV01951.1 MAG: epimerase [Nitrobacter sp. 62-23]